MTGYELPTSLNVGGVDCSIRTDFRAIIDILMVWNDPELDDDRCRALVMLQILYVDFDKIDQSYWNEAVEKACEFIDCGQKPDSKKRPRLMDWEQDASLIIPAVNKVAHTEVRALPYLHWWTFMAYFMEIGDSLFANVVSYRSNRAKNKKIEPWEREFYRENRSIIDLAKKDERSEEEKEELRALFGINKPVRK